MKETIIQHRRGLFVASLIAADASVIIASFFVAEYLRFHLLAVDGPVWHEQHRAMLQPAFLAVVAFLPALHAVGLYAIRRGWGRLDLLFSTLVAVGLGVMGFLAMSYLLKEFWYSRLMVWILALVVWVGLAGLRLLVKPALLWCFRRGFGVLRLVMVGESPAARSLAARIARNPHLGLRVLGHLVATGEPTSGISGEGGRLEEAFEELQGARPHICLFAEPIESREEMKFLLARCQEEGIAVWLGTDLHEWVSPRMELREVESIPIIALGSLRLASWERLLKRTIDVIGAAALLAVSAPFLLYAAIRTRQEIGPPLIFMQTRVGFQGRPFKILKLRALSSGLAFPSATRRDARAGTPFCDFLRAYSLDEIPQLWNVLRGEMSLVGPRPETPDRVRHYNPWNRRRLQVKPGITGLAQIAGVRGEHDFDTKSRFDVRYLESQSLLLDLQILFRTPLVVWKRRADRRGPRLTPRGRLPRVTPPGISDAGRAAALTEVLPRVTSSAPLDPEQAGAMSGGGA